MVLCLLYHFSFVLIYVMAILDRSAPLDVCNISRTAERKIVKFDDKRITLWFKSDHFNYYFV